MYVEMSLSIELAFPASHLAVDLAEILASALLAFATLLLACLVGYQIFALISPIASSTPSIISRLEAGAALPADVLVKVVDTAGRPAIGDVAHSASIIIVHVPPTLYPIYLSVICGNSAMIFRLFCLLDARTW